MAAVPMLTPVLKSEVRVNSPVPLGVIVRLSSDSVPIVAAEPAPRLKVVALTPRVAAEVSVVSPVAESVVSDESRVSVLEPELRVSPATPPDERVTAPAPV